MNEKRTISEEVSEVASFNGITVYKIESDKFKTNSISVFLHDNLRADTVTQNVLIPAVLKRGCEDYPTFKDIAIRLEELYGAGFGTGVQKKGETQIIQFYLEFVSDKYTGENSKQFEDALELIYSVITKPFLKDNIFKEEYVEQEKANLKMLIEGRINDKVSYASDRCYEEMCKDEPYGIYELGNIEDLIHIDAGKLFERYKLILETLPISIYIAGDFDRSNLDKLINRFSGIRRSETINVSNEFTEKHINDVKNITEKMNITQGKLSMGFRTNIKSSDDDYYKLMVYNSVLGGGMHSKLFQNVREKEGLAYYAHSRLEKFKGLMMISSGIDVNNRDKAVIVILKQIEDIKAGMVSDYEYESAIKSIETSINSLNDNQLQITDFYLGQKVSNTNNCPNTMVNKIKSVTKDDVVQIANKIYLDTIYFLTSV